MSSQPRKVGEAGLTVKFDKNSINSWKDFGHNAKFFLKNHTINEATLRQILLDNGHLGTEKFLISEKTLENRQK